MVEPEAEAVPVGINPNIPVSRINTVIQCRRLLMGVLGEIIRMIDFP
jgi:hypothetical protein